MRLPLYFVLFALLASPALAAPDYLIVTTDSLSPSIAGIVASKTQQGFTTQVVTVEDIQTAGTAGRDTAEQIRTYIQSVAAQGSLRFVLLVGDTTEIPVRHARNDFYPPPSGTDIPTDLYYAALDGDWDEDGDSVFGEINDNVDLDPEIAVGRVPVSTPGNAIAYTTKLNAYENTRNTSHLHNALFLEEVLFPANWQPGEAIQLDGADLGESLAVELLAAPTPFTLSKYYENHLPFAGALLLDKSAALAQLSSGNYGLVIHASHGSVTQMSMVDATVTAADVAGLANGPNYFVLLSHLSSGAKFDEDALLEDFLRNPMGGAIGVLGSSTPVFPTPWHDLELEFVQQLNAGSATIGEAWKATLSARAAAGESNGSARWTSMSAVLLGDPEVGVGSNAVTGARAPMPVAIALQGVSPNPFNPAVTITFEVRGTAATPVLVAIYDSAGRRVVVLREERFEPGTYDIRWNGLDRAGIPVASGVYLATVETLGQRDSRKMVLVR